MTQNFARRKLTDSIIHIGLTQRRNESRIELHTINLGIVKCRVKLNLAPTETRPAAPRPNLNSPRHLLP